MIFRDTDDDDEDNNDDNGDGDGNGDVDMVPMDLEEAFNDALEGGNIGPVPRRTGSRARRIRL